MTSLRSFIALTPPMVLALHTGSTTGTAGAITSTPAAASLLGSVAYTTVQSRTVDSSGAVLPIGEDIFGPFEAGFGAAQDGVIASIIGNNIDPSCAYSDGGVDTRTTESAASAACGVSLPGYDSSGTWRGFLDSCGGHTNDYHFHERLKCLYEETGTHSTKVADASDGKPVYGKWEDFSAGAYPELDACGGHYGATPEDSTGGTYHYHVQETAPFVIGCYGPNTDGSIVTVEQCRDLYTTCDDETETIVTTEGTIQYDTWCPCFDGEGKNYLPITPRAIEGGTTVDQTSESAPAPAPASEEEEVDETSESAPAPAPASEEEVETTQMSGPGPRRGKRGMRLGGGDSDSDDSVPYTPVCSYVETGEPCQTHVTPVRRRLFFGMPATTLTCVCH